MHPFQWANASTLEEAVKLLDAVGGKVDEGTNPDEMPRPMGGGQDLLTTMKDYLERPPRVVNLKTIKGLSGIGPGQNGGLRIGATTTLTEIEEHPEIRAKYPGLAEAAAAIATPQIRNVGTVGGNLCQRPRCWYFRLENVVCRKKGGNVCYAIQGNNKYNAIFDTGPSKIVHPSDLAPMLVALGATALVQGTEGQRTIPLEEFFITPADNVRRENVLKPADVIAEVQIPAPTGKSTYLKFKERESLDFAVASAAVVADFNPDKTVKAARIVLGGVASIPWHVPDAEKAIVGKKLDDATLTACANAALDGATPLSLNAYKVPLAQALLKRALTRLNT
jgi:xanthine dehydrogenase YagS FAD-binding subunit